MDHALSVRERSPNGNTWALPPGLISWKGFSFRSFLAWLLPKSYFSLVFGTYICLLFTRKHTGPRGASSSKTLRNRSGFHRLLRAAGFQIIRQGLCCFAKKTFLALRNKLFCSGDIWRGRRRRKCHIHQGGTLLGFSGKLSLVSLVYRLGRENIPGI